VIISIVAACADHRRSEDSPEYSLPTLRAISTSFNALIFDSIVVMNLRQIHQLKQPCV
jgi:hypothetical protein